LHSAAGKAERKTQKVLARMDELEGKYLLARKRLDADCKAPGGDRSRTTYARPARRREVGCVERLRIFEERR
jgi:hypothetical protein